MKVQRTIQVDAGEVSYHNEFYGYVLEMVRNEFNIPYIQEIRNYRVKISSSQTGKYFLRKWSSKCIHPKFDVYIAETMEKLEFICEDLFKQLFGFAPSKEGERYSITVTEVKGK